LPWAYGPRGTGKSTIAELLQTVLGPMATAIDSKYLEDDSQRERLGALIWNKRLAVCAESGKKRLDAELLKMLSGSDTIPVRLLFKEAFDTRPRHVLMMVANDPPRVEAHDDALRERVIALPFVHPLSHPEPLKITGGPRIEAARSDPASPLVRASRPGPSKAWSTSTSTKKFSARRSSWTHAPGSGPTPTPSRLFGRPSRSPS
jgi:hypothetical protein